MTKDGSVEIPTVVVGGKAYVLQKSGVRQAEQIALLGRWLSKHGSVLASTVASAQEGEERKNDLFLLVNALGGLTAESLVDLFEVVVGCPPSVAREEFDIGILIEGVVALFDNPSIKRVIERFFSGNG